MVQCFYLFTIDEREASRQYRLLSYFAAVRQNKVSIIAFTFAKAQCSRGKIQFSTYSNNLVNVFLSYYYNTCLMCLFQWKTELEEIIQMAMEDSEPWVSMVANILKVFPENGTLTTEVDERHNYFHELLADLRKTSV